MPKRYQNAIRFSPSKRRRVEAEFTGAEVNSNGGLPLLAEADRRMGLTRAAADAMGDDRRRKSVVHSTLSIVRQRVYALVLGHEDLNDHDGLRRDTALQAAAGRDAALASPSTLCRFERRVVAKAEHSDLGPNTRFVVTNLDIGDDPQGLYDGLYCERGEMENRIKDQQLGLFADRASSSDFDANQLRLLLSGLAYALIEGMRRMALSATELAKASPNTIRLTLLKVGAVVLSNTRRVRLLMSRSHPNQALFRRVAAALAAQPP